MALQFYSTLSKKKEVFEPVTPGKIGIYVCGPTVYKDSHIGHAVGPVIFDALKKYLTYKGYQVKLVINITDVDDKLINESQARGMSMADLAREVSDGYFDAIEQLGVDSVDEYPRATEHIDAIIDLIQRMGEKDAAYVADGDVYFDVTKFSAYGKLSNRRSEDQVEGSRELAGSGKRNTADFALWKKVGDDDPIFWESPWGRGRPGWHIECSAMSIESLGETYDIHGGGVDLVFPHHENEIAQSETATGKVYAKYWMHNGLTRIKTKAASGDWQDEKMSKSLGNIRSIKDLLTEYPGPIVRFFLLSTHYRRPIDFSDEALQAVQKGLMSIYRVLERVERLGGGDVHGQGCDVSRMNELAQDEAAGQLAETFSQGQLRYLEALDDDFNTAAAIAVLFDLCNALNRYLEQHAGQVRGGTDGEAFVVEAARMITSLGKIIGLLEGPIEQGGGDEMTEQLMAMLIELRAEAKAEKNFALSDAIRDKLKAVGVVLEDKPDKTTEWRRGS